MTLSPILEDLSNMKSRADIWERNPGHEIEGEFSPREDLVPRLSAQINIRPSSLQGLANDNQ